MQVNELVASINGSLLVNSKYFEGIVYSFDKVLRLKTAGSTLEIYDLVYLSNSKTYFKHSDWKRIGDQIGKTGFIGIVVSISTGIVADDQSHTDVIDIKISSKHYDSIAKILQSNTKLFYKY